MISIKVKVKRKLDTDDMTRRAMKGLKRGITRVLSDAQRISREKYFRPGFAIMPGPNKRGGGPDPIPGILTTRHGGHGLLGTVRYKVTGGDTVSSKVKGILGAYRPYARIHELGGRAGRGLAAVIPPRPYLRPALEDAWREDWELLRGYILEELRFGR